MKSNCECCNKKYKYILTLTHPENSRYGKIPCKIGQPTTTFKRRRQIEYTTNNNGYISLHWTPQAFYFTNDGIFLYNGVTYNGIVTGTPIVTGLGVDSTNFVPTGTPIRLVGASMKIIYGGGSSVNAYGVFVGGSYETPIASNIADNNMSIFSNINNLKNVKTVQAMDGMKIIYTPYDQSCYSFYKMNTHLGRDGVLGNGLINTQRLLFYGTQLTSNTNCIIVTYTQIFEAVTTSDYFNPYSNYVNWNPGEFIKKYINDRNMNVIPLKDDIGFENEIRSNLVVGKKKMIAHPEKIKNLRLPSSFGESTCLFHQKSTFNITTNATGVFCIQWFPQFYHTSGNPAQSGIYYANNVGFDGLSGAVVTQANVLDFTSTASPVFTNVRLVSASMKIMYSGKNSDNNGEFLGGINFEIPPFSGVPLNTNYDYNSINNMMYKKIFKGFDGMKMIYVPYDYSCLNFFPPDYLTTYNNNDTLAYCMYMIGYNISANANSIKIIFDRVFEGIPNTYLADYFSTESSKYTMDDFKSLTDDDLIITRLNKN